MSRSRRARTPPADDVGDEAVPQEPPLTPAGNSPRWIRGGVGLFATSALFVLLVSLPGGSAPRLLASALLVVAAAAFAIDLSGAFDDRDATISTSLRSLGGAVAALVAALALDIGLFQGLVSGRLSASIGGPLLTASVIGTFAALGWCRHGLSGKQPSVRALLTRPGFWLLAIGAVLHIPVLGAKTLIDPWETHYGEVAREILARDDYISLWWAQDGWFFSKPVLSFWLQALAMRLGGVDPTAGNILGAEGTSAYAWPEWALRMPSVALALVAVYLLYRAGRAAFGERGAFLGGVVLLTMPYWSFVTQQAMTDMPFVATMSASMACFALALQTSDDTLSASTSVSVGRRSVTLSVHTLVVGGLLLAAIPQALYLLSLHLHWVGGLPQWTVDSFASGSPGNCGLPGNAACATQQPVLERLHPAIQSLVWVQAIGILVYAYRGERRKRRLLLLAAWLFAALATMGKGPVGIGLPVLTVGAFLFGSGRMKDLATMQLPTGMLAWAVLTLPWFVAMYARHGAPFTDRLLFHDMFKRAFEHVHDTNNGQDVSFRYYIWQLGYGTFPWSGVALPGFIAAGNWLRQRPASAQLLQGPSPGNAATDTSRLLLLWVLLGFCVFSYVQTKYHHYILPIVPAIAMLLGGLVGSWIPPITRTDSLRVAGAIGSVLLYAAGLQRLFANGSAWSIVVLVTSASLLIVIIEKALPSTKRPRSRTFSLAPVAALAVFVIGRDLFTEVGYLPNQARLLHLFTYRYNRLFPEEIDFRPTLAALTVVAAGSLALVGWRKLSRIGWAAFIASSLIGAAWSLWVYFPAVAPHWGQRELMVRYRHEQRAHAGPIIAYQLNWKGENFYTGNAIAAFVTSGGRLRPYVDSLREKGTRTFYFVTEHARVSGLSAELGRPALERLTTERENNKFVLVRVDMP